MARISRMTFGQVVGCLLVVAAMLTTVDSAAVTQMEFRVGASLALMLAFTVIWLACRRPLSAGWMTAIWAMLTLETLTAGSGLGPSPWLATVHDTSRLALMLAAAGLGSCLLQQRVRAGWHEVLVVATCCVYGIVQRFCPPDLAAQLDGVHQLQAGALALAATAVAGGLAAPALVPKRQKFNVAVIAVLVAALISYIALGKGAWPWVAAHLPVVDFSLNSLLGALVLTGLVSFPPPALQGEVESPAAVRDAAALLCQAARAEFMPAHVSGNFGEFEREMVRRGAAALGDWSFVWETPFEQRLFVGQVFAPMAQLGLGVAAVCLLLGEAKRQDLGLTEALQQVNQHLFSLFDRRVTATVLGVSLGDDGSVDLVNCGGCGFFTLSRDGARHWPLISTPLGQTRELLIGQAPVPLDDLDLLFAGTGGVISGQAGTDRLLSFYDQSDLSLELAVVRDQIFGLRRVSDQGTLLIVQRRFAHGQIHSRA